MPTIDLFPPNGPLPPTLVLGADQLSIRVGARITLGCSRGDGHDRQGSITPIATDLDVWAVGHSISQFFAPGVGDIFFQVDDVEIVDIKPESLEAQVVGACLLSYLLRLLWQCFLFVRTDFYFVLATAFNCKNLLVDIQDFLRNQLARIFPSWPTVDQSSIPTSETRVVRWYSLLWLAGRAAAFVSLLFVTGPIVWRYAVAIAPLPIGGRSRYGVVDALAVGFVTVGVNGAGMAMWIRALCRRAYRSYAR